MAAAFDVHHRRKYHPMGTPGNTASGSTAYQESRINVTVMGPGTLLVFFIAVVPVYKAAELIKYVLNE